MFPICLRTYLKTGVRRVSGLFGPLFECEILGVIYGSRYYPPEFESKIGSKEPESRQNPVLEQIFHSIAVSYWQLSHASPKLHALGVSASLTISTLLEADLFFIQRGWRPRLLMSTVDFSICVAPRVRR